MIPHHGVRPHADSNDPRLLTSAAGERRYISAGGAIGCNPLFDPLWADARFRAAMRALTVEACPLVGAWPLAPRPGE